MGLFRSAFDVVSPLSQKPVAPKEYKDTSLVLRTINQVIGKPALLLMQMITLRNLGGDFRKKAFADPAVQDMMRSIDRLALNLGISLADCGGPVGELASWAASGYRMVGGKRTSIPDVSRFWTMVTETIDVCSAGLLPSHLVLTGIQTCKDLPKILKGIGRLMSMISAEQSLYGKYLKKPVGMFLVKPAAVATYPIRHPFKTVANVFHGVTWPIRSIFSKKSSNEAADPSLAHDISHHAPAH